MFPWIIHQQGYSGSKTFWNFLGRERDPNKEVEYVWPWFDDANIDTGTFPGASQKVIDNKERQIIQIDDQTPHSIPSMTERMVLLQKHFSARGQISSEGPLHIQRSEQHYLNGLSHDTTESIPAPSIHPLISEVRGPGLFREKEKLLGYWIVPLTCRGN